MADPLTPLCGICMVVGPYDNGMSRSELERLVGEAEDRSALRQQLQRTRSPEDLVRMARSLGYGITTGDLQRAREDHEASIADETGWLLP